MAKLCGRDRFPACSVPSHQRCWNPGIAAWRSPGDFVNAAGEGRGPVMLTARDGCVGVTPTLCCSVRPCLVEDAGTQAGNPPAARSRGRVRPSLPRSVPSSFWGSYLACCAFPSLGDLRPTCPVTGFFLLESIRPCQLVDTVLSPARAFCRKLPSEFFHAAVRSWEREPGSGDGPKHLE